MNKKKVLIIIGVVLIVLLSIGVTYAIRVGYGQNGIYTNKLIAGDIYMRYKESNQLSFANATPTNDYVAGQYFEFQVIGKNQYKQKDIVYDVVINHGDNHATRTTRIDDKFLRFRLVEVENYGQANESETQIWTNKKYNSINNTRIYASRIPKNTLTEITKTYRLYMWISNEVVIGNVNADYDDSVWNNQVYASIKVNVTGDFNEKVVPVELSRVSNQCYSVGFDEDPFTYAYPSDSDTLNACTTYLSSNYDTSGYEDSGMGYDECEDMAYYVYGNDFSTLLSEYSSGIDFDNPGTLPINDLEFFIENDIVTTTDVGATITNYDDTCGNAIEIPSELYGNTVETIGSSAFQSKNLIGVSIPNSVTTIENGAFYDNQLTSLTIPNSVTTIENGAFYGNQLTSLTIPNSVETIGTNEEYNGAFESNYLTSVTIPNSVTTIGYNAFGYNQLTSITIPNSVTTIGESAFLSNQLTSVTIPNSVETIGVDAFRDNQLTSVIIPNSVITIGFGAFQGNNLTSVTLGNSVETIEGVAFYMNQLTSITIPNSVTTIGEYAFEYNNLGSVTIPSSVTSLSCSAFDDNYGYTDENEEYHEFELIYENPNLVCE